MTLKVVTELDFEAEVLLCELPVLIDFFADWCAPCKQVAPEIEALAVELEGKAKFVKVDIERSKQLASMFRIQAVPTFVVFAQGRPVAMEQGVVRKARFREMLEPFLPRAQGALKPAELASLLASPGSNVVAVDIRDAGSYGRAHIIKAANMPLEEIEGRLAELFMLGTCVIYCRLGDKSQELSEKLASDGIDLPFLEGGFLAWEAEMLPIERGTRS